MKCKVVGKKILRPAFALWAFEQKHFNANTNSVWAKLGPYKRLANYYTLLQTETVGLSSDPLAESQCHIHQGTNI